MHALLDGIPLDEMNTSMTINATAAWLLALYIVVAEENGLDPAALQGTTQNDIIKEFLARGTYAFPPGPVDAADRRHGRLHGRARPALEPDQHLLLPPAGGGRDAGAGDRLRDGQRHRGARRRPRARRRGAHGQGLRAHLVLRQRRRALRRGARQAARDGRRCGRSSAASATACSDPKHLRFRYGVQVNSLGLTESQPENNVQRIVLEALAVTLGRDARARAIQLPAWNEALGLPRPWDQQWSLRIQQVLAYETDLLEYPDIFEGSKVMDGLVAELLEGARAEMAIVDEHGGAVEAVDYMKAALVDSHRERIRRIEAGEQVVVGVNRYTETEPSPLLDGRRRRHPHRRPGGRGRSSARRSSRWRAERDQAAVDAALAELRRGRRRRREHHAGDDRRRARRRDDRRVGRRAARGVRRVPRARPASARRPPAPADRRRSRRCARRSTASARRSGGG